VAENIIGRMQTALQNWFSRLGFFTLCNALAQLLGFAYMVVVARGLGSDLFGRFTGNYALLTVTAILFNFGLDTWLLRSSPIHPDAKGQTSKVLVIKTSLGISWALIIIPIFIHVRPDLYRIGILLPAAMDLLGDGLFNTILVGLNVRGEVRKAGILLVTCRLIRIITAVALFMLHNQYPETYTLFRMLSTWSLFFIALINFRPRLQFPQKDHFSIIKQALPYWTSDVLAAFYLQADVVLLAFMAGEKAVGQYSPASNLVNAGFVFSSAGLWIFIPELVRVGRENIAASRKVIRRMFLWFSALGVPLFALIIILSRWLIRILFGTAYAQTQGLLLVLSLLVLMKPYEYGCIAILIARDKQNQRLIPQFASAVINIISNIILIPTFGAYGAAISYLVSEAVLLTGYILLSIRELNQIETTHDA
jgi:O-antigen/teichoic acid export membrane protein